MAIKLTQVILKSRAMIGQIELTVSLAADMPYDICVHMLSSGCNACNGGSGNEIDTTHFFFFFFKVNCYMYSKQEVLLYFGISPLTKSVRSAILTLHLYLVSKQSNTTLDFKDFVGYFNRRSG